MKVTEPPTLNVIAEALTERLVTVRVDEVGEVGDELPPQAAVTAAAMTVATKQAWRDFKICLPPTTMWMQIPILLELLVALAEAVERCCSSPRGRSVLMSPR